MWSLLGPSSFKVWPVSLKVWPGSLKVWPGSLKVWPGSLKVWPGSLKVWPGSLKVRPSRSYGASIRYGARAAAPRACYSWCCCLCSCWRHSCLQA